MFFDVGAAGSSRSARSARRAAGPGLVSLWRSWVVHMLLLWATCLGGTREGAAGHSVSRGIVSLGA